MIGRKLDSVLQELKLLEKQGKVEGFFTNFQNAEKLAGLVEDIWDEVMDYQVCDQTGLISLYLIPVLDFAATKHLWKELSAYCEPHSFIDNSIC